MARTSWQALSALPHWTRRCSQQVRSIRGPSRVPKKGDMTSSFPSSSQMLPSCIRMCRRPEATYPCEKCGANSIIFFPASSGKCRCPLIIDDCHGAMAIESISLHRLWCVATNEVFGPDSPDPHTFVWPDVWTDVGLLSPLGSDQAKRKAKRLRR